MGVGRGWRRSSRWVRSPPADDETSDLGAIQPSPRGMSPDGRAVVSEHGFEYHHTGNSSNQAVHPDGNGESLQPREWFLMTSGDSSLRPRLATNADAGTIVATLAASFDEDPLWTWVFPDREKRAEQFERWFGFFVESALPNGFVWIADEGAAVSVWTPPEKSELSEEAEAAVEPFLSEALGSHSGEVLEVMEDLEAACPKARPFYYLSFLGTHPEERGRGVGMGLLAANLARIDATGMPAYLESSNPANNGRYERLGFRPRTEFSTPDGEHDVTTMWREAR